MPEASSAAPTATTPSETKPNPQTLVDALRSLSEGVGKLGRSYFFPPKEGEEVQPVPLEGVVDSKELAGLLHYLADMLEE